MLVHVGSMSDDRFSAQQIKISLLCTVDLQIGIVIVGLMSTQRR